MSRSRAGSPTTSVPRAALLVVAAAVLWGTTGTAQALGPDAARSEVVGALRLIIGGAGLWLVSLVRGRLPRVPVGAMRTLLVGGVAVAAYQLTFFTAVRLTGVAVGTILGIGSAPVFGLLVDATTTRQWPAPRRLAATVVALTGAALLVATVDDDAGLDLAGVAAALGAGASYALYAWAVRSLGRAGHPDDAVTTVFGLGAILLAPIVVVAGAGPELTDGGLAMIAHLGIVTVTVSYLLFGRGAVVLPVGTTTTLSLAEPATAALLAVTVLDERLVTAQWFGAALVVLGLFAVVRADVAERGATRPVARS